MSTTQQSPADVAKLALRLRGIIGVESVVDAVEELRFLSCDVYSQGELAVLAICPDERATLLDAIRLIGESGFDIVPRGGGMSYTSGYTPVNAKTVIVDLRQLNRIVDINADDMTITVEAGVTWKQIYEALQPLGLRLPFFGTFSGSHATVGGGMSNGAIFFGSTAHGSAAEIALGFEVITAKGQLIRTGQAGFRDGRPFYRTYGPDLTGLFVHAAGALGVKTLISMRLIRTPSHTQHASFVFDNLVDTVEALSEVARSGVAEETYVLDPEATRSGMGAGDLRKDIKRLVNVIKGQGSIATGLWEGAKLVGAGRDFIDNDLFSLHVVCSGHCKAAADSKIASVGEVVAANNGGEIANSIPKTARANPFEPLNGILGADGHRWVALNCKVAHSDAAAIIQKTEKVFDLYRDAMRDAGVRYSRLCIAISNHVFSFEPVLRWDDEWLPLHHRIPEPSHLAKLNEPEANPTARKLVDAIRSDIVELFAEFGAASNQIGKTYRYFEALHAESASLLMNIKASLDPDNQMNPGALGLPASRQGCAPDE